jgi:NADP-dependent aldehyde dehydrogenase
LNTKDFLRCARALEGQLTATVWAESHELKGQDEFLWTLQQHAGRLVFNGFPTGVEVGRATVHGGPFPATTDSRFTSVGTRAVARFIRPVAFQNELT